MGNRRNKTIREQQGFFTKEILKQSRQSRQLRPDCIQFIRDLIPNGWDFNETIAHADGWHFDFAKAVMVSPVQLSLP